MTEIGPRGYSGKRAFDVVFATVGVILTFPFMMLAAIAVKVSSPGPILYRAERVGHGESVMTVHKFRSMHASSTGPAVTAAGDPRVTAVGKLIRRFKIDELPQFFDVLRGEMSIVGPRPEDPRFVADYNEVQREVLQWRPGMTSPASLEYRDEEAVLAEAASSGVSYEQLAARKIVIDTSYMRRASLRSDVVIVLRTAWAVFS